MTEQTNPQDSQAAFEAWAKEQLKEMCKYLFEAGMIEKEAEAQVAWSLPHEICIGRVWEKTEPDELFWVIAGDVPTDHIAFTLAETPKDAARHFAMKWQLDSARVASMATPEAADLTERIDWSGISQTLAAKAEVLFEIIERDEVWQR